MSSGKIIQGPWVTVIPGRSIPTRGRQETNSGLIRIPLPAAVIFDYQNNKN